MSPPITTRERSNQGDIRLVRWQEANLQRASWVRLTKINTLEKTMVSQLLGRMDKADRRVVTKALKELFIIDD